MIRKLRELLGFRPATDYKELLEQGAVIVDVRTKAEFEVGHIKGSKNTPLQTLHAKPFFVKDKNLPIITCCASGMRSASAKSILKAKGYTNVYNGGGWSSLNRKITQ